MDGSGTLQQTLGAMGFKELALAFVAVGGYALALNASLSPNARLRALAMALAVATAFVALAEPWVHGFILVVLGVAGIGIFTALVWAVSAACGFTGRNAPADLEPAESTEAALAVDAPGLSGAAALDGVAAPVAPCRPASPAHPA